MHVHLLAFDRGVRAVALDDEAQGEGRMPVRARDFARQDRLQPGEQRVGRLRRLERRVDEHEDAPFRLGGAHQLRRPRAQRPDLVVAPDGRDGLGSGLARREGREHRPQRFRVVRLGVAR